MLIIFRPFSKGDFVEAGGTAGVVDDINIFTTVMTTGDNKEVIVPNGAIVAGTITNYSARPTRRVDMVFGISYDDDLRKAKQLLAEIIAAAIRNSRQIADAAVAGAHCITAGFAVYQDSFRNPYTNMGEEIFRNAWDATPES